MNLHGLFVHLLHVADVGLQHQCTTKLFAYSIKEVFCVFPADFGVNGIWKFWGFCVGFKFRV